MRLLWLPLICTLAGACDDAQRMTVLAGRLEGLDSKYLILYRSTDRYGYREWLQALDTIAVDKDGSFRFEIPSISADLYQVCNEEGFTQTADIYLSPGDSMYVARKKDGDKLSFTYSGKCSMGYDYYLVRDSLQKKEPLFKGSNRDVYYLSEDSAVSVLNTRLRWEMDVIDTLFQDGECVPLATYYRDQRRFSAYDEYFRYLYYHNYYSNDTFVYLLPAPAYYDFMKDVDLTYCPEYYCYEYLSFQRNYVQDKIEHMLLPDSVRRKKDLALRFQVIKENFTDRSRDAALFGLTREFSDALGNDDFFDLVDEIDTYFVQNVTDTLFLQKFRKVAQEFTALKSGAPAPNIALPDANGNTITLSDFRGKVVYVDFWGTWCNPCLRELPHSLNLQKEFEGQPVEFLYIALESGEEQMTEWREFISGKRSFSYATFLEQRVYPGIHLVSEGQFNNPELKPYKLSVAPTYMLIDADGNIVSARAPRPSNAETEKLIRETLNRK